MSPDYDLEREILQLEQRYAENAHGLVFAHLADAYRRAGEYAKAEGLLLHGLKTHPSYTSAYNVLGRVYIDSERFEDAQAQFARVLELDPQNLISLRALGDLAARRGQVDDARGWYERMLHVDPRSEEAREGLTRLATSASAAAETPPPEPAEPEPAVGGFEPGSPGFELPDVPADESAEVAALGEGSGEPDEPSLVEIEDRDLETVEKVKADFEPIEGLIGDEGMSGVSIEDIAAEPGEPEAPRIEERAAEPWEVDSADEPWSAEEAELEESREEWAAGPDEPWTQSAGASPTEESPESEGEEAEPWLMAESESLELPSMDDWSPGFVVGELLEGQAAEELRPEEILEGLDAEYTFEAPEEPAEEPDWTGTSEDERKGEGVVTETMAELYFSQGLYSDALAVYQRLAEARPDDERLQSRILDLQQRIEEAGLAPDEEELVRLMNMTEPEEEGPSAATIDAIAPEPGLEFEFEDQAPFAGFDQLDPFAASFDTLSAKTHSAEPSSLEAPAADEPEQQEPAGEWREPEPVEPIESAPGESEPVPVESLAEEPVAEDLALSIESPEAGFMDLGSGVDESAAEVVAEEVMEEIEYAAGDEGITAVDSIWELTEVGAPDREVDQMAEGSEEVEVPVRIDDGEAEPREPSSMENYVASLLAFDVERLFETSASSPDSQEDEPPASPESPNAQDLEQFQEWLRSLKR